MLKIKRGVRRLNLQIHEASAVNRLAPLPQAFSARPQQYHIGEYEQAQRSISMIKATPIDVLIETMKGYDEISMKTQVDKISILGYIGINNVDQIQQLQTEQLKDILRVGKISQQIYAYLDVDELRAAVRNLMLGVVEKMSNKEFSHYMSEINWATFGNNWEQNKEALRVYVQYPQCQLFNVTKYKGVVFGGHLRTSNLELSEMEFIPNIVVRKVMTYNQLKSALTQRYQSVQGDRQALVDRLLAFQEFVMLRAFERYDARLFLSKIYWNVHKDIMNTDSLRKRCVQYLHFPYCQNWMRRSLHNESYSMSWSEEQDEVLKKSYKSAVELYKHHRNWFDLSQDQQVGAFSPTQSSSSSSSFMATSLTPYYNSDLIREAVNQYLPSHVRVARSHILYFAPRFAFDGQTRLWSIADEVLWRARQPDFWLLVSGIARYNYQVKKTADQCMTRYNDLQRRNTASQAKNSSYLFSSKS
ncbi:hypothetical protein MIR68_003195 [Amoeboaphelidium protococcarum]|nr:hypothetical protein MIR68_003195 [Amoeboaphelidium protococcarum]